jgi:hypothetical protein
LFLIDSYIKIYSIADMVKYSLLFLVLLVTTTYAQIGSDGTGTVNGYSIGPGADLFLANLTGADLTGADLSGANLSDASLFAANLTGANLTGADLKYASLFGANLTGANLTGADLRYANLTGATLTRVISGNITGTPTLTSPYLMAGGYIVGPDANLTGADLSGADLYGSNLSGADLRYANLSSADLRRANLILTDLSGANLSGAKVNQDEIGDSYINYANNFPLTIFTNVISQSDYDAVVAERDVALAAQATVEAERDAALAAQATAEAERDAKLTLDEVKDLRAGSTMIEIENGQATLSMEVEESDDLAIWTSGGTTNLTVPADTGTKFFRFKMAE